MQLSQTIASDNFRFLEDVDRAVEKYRGMLDELLSLHRMYVKQTASMFLQVNIKGPKLSPQAEVEKSSPIKTASLEKLRKNYAVIRDLWATSEEIDRMIVRVRQTFAHREVDVQKSIDELEKLKKKAQIGLAEAFNFVSGLAQDHMPSKFLNTNQALSRILAKSIAYEDVKDFTYLHEVDGKLVWSTYFQLLRVQDDEGHHYPEMIIVSSYMLTETGAQTYIGLMDKFVPPSDRVLMKEVSTVKEITRALNMLLALDHFSNTIGSLPTSMYLKDAKIDRELLLYQQYVKSIRVEENRVIMVLKPEITDKEMAARISHQMWLDFSGITSGTNARVLMSMKPPTRSDDKCYVITISFVNNTGSDFAQEVDLGFLKERFALSDITIKKILRTINQG